MSRSSGLPVGLAKELRALAPAWLGATIVVGGAALFADARIRSVWILAYGLGTVALGAQSMGHEYTHRAIPLLLSQPSTRPRLFLTKLGALATMILLLAAAGAVTAIRDPTFQHVVARQPIVVLLPALCAICLAPWMTMLCRGLLPGAVFTVAIPGALMVAADVTAALVHGVDTPAADSLQRVLWVGGMAALCAVGAVSGWRLFMRLEAVEGSGPGLHWPGAGQRAARARRTLRRRHAIWMLVIKEIRLQQLTFVIAGLYVLGWGAAALLREYTPVLGRLPVTPVALLYVSFVSILVGSLASAAERQFGTLEWQTLLPMSARRQWSVKVGMALCLALVLGAALPWIVMLAGPANEGEMRAGSALWRQALLQVGLLTSGSLYLSSLSTSGVRAVAMSFTVSAGAAMATAPLSVLGLRLLRAFSVAPHSWPLILGPVMTQVLAALIVAAFILVVLRFAAINHRSAERGTRRVWSQASWMGASFAVAVLLLTGLVL